MIQCHGSLNTAAVGSMFWPAQSSSFDWSWTTNLRIQSSLSYAASCYLLVFKGVSAWRSQFLLWLHDWEHVRRWDQVARRWRQLIKSRPLALALGCSDANLSEQPSWEVWTCGGTSAKIYTLRRKANSLFSLNKIQPWGVWGCGIDSCINEEATFPSCKHMEYKRHLGVNLRI